MESFVYQVPTKVIFGKDAELQIAPEAAARGVKRTLLVYGGGSVVKNGLLARMEESLAKSGIEVQTLGGVQPNPRLQLARKGVQQALAFGAELILAVGGGSVIDTAKAIAIGTANPDTDIWEFWLRHQTVTKALPVAVVLTISAAGSETSDSAVLTDDETNNKRGLNSPFNRPAFSALNPELTMTLPKFQITCGTVDIMMHTMDRYFNPVMTNQVTDELAEALLRVVIRNGPVALANPHDYNAMSELMWAGSLSHNELTGLGARKDFAPHQLGHELSGKFDVAHGASLSAIWSSWATYTRTTNPERFARFGKNVWGLTGSDTEELSKAAIEAADRYFRSLDMPTNFTELGIGVQTEEVIEELAWRCSFQDTRTIGTFQKLNRQDMAEIYRLANR
ncbi:iron-containing alcohol dehydrogenase [Clostridium sp. MSTE9]|uniref:iron-containing alcohol dehydrogenase n=1 Tax=Clostridium sp. (strain MSTE9) TaxID=1105031 RepID=UPI000557B016|nr:iron-containing alcohol dehydrogenase [Clostridium sp. MSTE9]